MYASSGGHETVCREDEERILCKYLTNNALQRLHDWAATTARLGRNCLNTELLYTVLTIKRLKWE